MNKLRLKNEKEVKINFGKYCLVGFSCDDKNSINSIFNLALSKIRYRKAILEYNFNLPEVRDNGRYKKISERIKKNDIYFLELIDKIKKDFKDFCSLDTGTLFELFVYYMLMEFFDENGIEARVVRNLNVSYKGEAFTEIDLFVDVFNKKFIFECKNRYISSNAILKLYGIMKMLDINFGILASTKEFYGNIKKGDIFEEYNIYIIDNLLIKEKNKIFKELKEIFEINQFQK
ncbi:hypothetical protein ACO3VM_01590 [Methanocaldococcus sp. 10A]